MIKAFAQLAAHVRRMRPAYIVLLIALAPTLFAFYRVRKNVEARDKARFEKIVHDGQAALEKRLGDYADELYSVRGLFAASESVEADEWTRYFRSVDVPQRHPGIRSIGYVEKVPASEKDKLVAQLRSEGIPDFAIEPPGWRAVYYPVIYFTNFDPELGARIGYDPAWRPERLAPLDAACAANKPFATASVDVSLPPGAPTNAVVFIYLPVYRNGSPGDTPAERSRALQGFLFASFTPRTMLAGLLGDPAAPSVDWEVFEGARPGRAQLLYDSDAILRTLDGPKANSLQRIVSLQVLNRTWTLSFTALPGFAVGSQSYLPWLTLAAGLVVSLLLFGIACVQVRARRQAEKGAADLQRSESELAAEKERLAVTLQSIAEGVITTDTQGRIVSSNKAAEQLVGQSSADMKGRLLAEVFHVAGESPGEPCPNIAGKALQSGEAVDMQDLAILEAPDGAKRAITSSAAPIRDPAGCLFGVVLVFRDVTERRKTEEEMLRESKLESVGLLAGGIAHDFNNILTAIIGNVSLARMSSHSTEKMLERLMGVERAAIRARDLTQQLLTFAKGGSPIRQPTQLPGLVKDACQFALHGSNVRCEYSLPADIWPVELDEGQFRQIFNHLVINAMQSMPEGGQIEVKLENVELTGDFLPPLPGGKYVRITMKDHGSGINAEVLPRIFEPYFTTKKGGSGLGLATTYAVVRKHDGQIRVESTVGAGTTFSIYLPASAQRPAAGDDSHQSEFFGRGRLLIMDDEPDILAIASEMLRSFGCQVETAKDGAEAIEKYVAAKDAGRRFDAVIMDLTVPNGMGGREAIRGLTELDPHVKAIVSSGYSFDPVMANYRHYGFSGIIPKPYRAEDLSRVLAEVLGGEVVAA